MVEVNTLVTLEKTYTVKMIMNIFDDFVLKPETFTVSPLGKVFMSR